MSIVSKNGMILVRYTARNQALVGKVPGVIYRKPEIKKGIIIRDKMPDIFVPKISDDMPVERDIRKVPLGSLVLEDGRIAGVYEDRLHCIDLTDRKRYFKFTNFEPSKGVRTNCEMSEILIPITYAPRLGLTDRDVTRNSLVKTVKK